jgi:putative transposase
MPNYRRIFEDGYSYYLTIVTHRRNPILIDNITLLRQSFVQSKKRFSYRIDAIVILPDHIHMVITPKKSTDYPKIIGAIKACFSRYYEGEDKNVEQSNSRYKKRYKAVWQKKYYEHTIRNEKDWYETMKYIKHNPTKHGLVDDINNWEYSSFFERR